MSCRNSARACGSRPATGSSSTSTFGFMASTPANATRRCWPPESSKGLLACSASKSSRTLSRARRTRRSTSGASSPRLRGPNATSSYTVAANSWYSGYWNTMPMRPRKACAAFLSARSCPPTSTRPQVGCTSPFMCWMSVLLPLPVCPAMPKNSPSSSVKSMPRSAQTASGAVPQAGFSSTSSSRERGASVVEDAEETPGSEGAGTDPGLEGAQPPMGAAAVASGAAPAPASACPCVAAFRAARCAARRRFFSRRRCFSARSGSS